MPDLLCPRCNDETGAHGSHGCYANFNTCPCELTEAEALRAAQRLAAAEHLLGLLVEYWQLKKIRYTAGLLKWHQILLVARAYRAVGVMGRKVKHDPA